MQQLHSGVIAMILDYGMCCLYTETISFEAVLSLLPLNDLRGNIPLHCIIVGRFLRLLPILVAWARCLWVELQPLVWVAVLSLASMGSTVTCSICHGNIWPLVFGLGLICIHHKML